MLAVLTRGLLGTNHPITSIETSFYGTLAPYSKWLLLSLLNGIWEDIDRSTDYNHALKYLEEMVLSILTVLLKQIRTMMHL
jgi:hypothetical protein